MSHDSNHIRYELYQTNEGKPYNWLFFPGGPGADSSYLRSLVDELKLPGNVWLIDLPGNGSNVAEGYSEFLFGKETSVSDALFSKRSRALL